MYIICITNQMILVYFNAYHYVAILCNTGDTADGWFHKVSHICLCSTPKNGMMIFTYFTCWIFGMDSFNYPV